MNKLRITILASVLLFLTFVRENTFLVINGAISGGNSYKAYIEVPEWLREFSKIELITTKWLLTLVFILVFAGISFLILNLMYHNTKYNRWLFYLFGIISVICVVLFLLSSTLLPGLYDPSRRLLTLIQSPILLMLFVLFTLIHQKFKDFVT